MAQSYAGFREEAGGGESDAYAGSEFNHGRTYDKLIVISRSGTTSEVVDLLKKSKIHLIKLDAYIKYGLLIVGAFGSYSLGANNIANVNQVGTYIANVNTVAGNTSNINSVFVGILTNDSVFKIIFVFGVLL